MSSHENSPGLSQIFSSDLISGSGTEEIRRLVKYSSSEDHISHNLRVHILIALTHEVESTLIHFKFGRSWDSIVSFYFWGQLCTVCVVADCLPSYISAFVACPLF